MSMNVNNMKIMKSFIYSNTLVVVPLWMSSSSQLIHFAVAHITERENEMTVFHSQDCR